MLQSFTVLLTLLGSFVVAHPHDALVSTLIARQTTAPPPNNCTSPCGAFTAVKKACKGISNCGCTDKFLQAQGDCLVCQAGTPGGAAAVQFTLDAEINQCHLDGIPITFQLQLPPEAQAILDGVNRQSADLRAQQRAFLALQIMGGHIGLTFVLIFSVFSRKIRRDPTFLNFCITWIFSSIVYSILLYRGTEGNSVINSLGRVPQDRCLAQAALINGAQVMTACSTMALVIQLWMGLHTAIKGDLFRGDWQKYWITIALLASPYVVFLAFTIPSIVVGKQHIILGTASLQRVLPTNFYCSVVELSSFLQAVYGVTLVFLIVTTVFDGLIINILYQHWWAFRHVQTKSAVSLSILIRVVVFSIYRVVVAVAYGTVLNKPPQVIETGSGDTLSVAFGVPTWVDMLQAAIPLVGFLVLGVNNDILASMMFWRRFQKKRAVGTMQSINTNGTNSNTITLVNISPKNEEFGTKDKHSSWRDRSSVLDIRNESKSPV